MMCKIKSFSTLCGVLVLGSFSVSSSLAQTHAALVQSVDEPGRTPFALHSAHTAASPESPVTFTVPPGLRYVVETYSSRCQVTTGTAAVTTITLNGTTQGVPVTLYVQPHLNGSVFLFLKGYYVNVYVGTGTQTLYADPGSTLKLYPDITGTGFVEGCEFWITGHAIAKP